MNYCDSYYSLIYCLKNFVIYYLSIVYSYCLSSFCLGHLRNFQRGRSKNIYFESLNVNHFCCNSRKYFRLSLILNIYFDIGCLNSLIGYI